MLQDLSIPSPDNVLELLSAFRRSKVMFAAVSLGVFELLHKQPLTAKQIAEQLKSDLGATERLLDSIVGLRLIERKAELYSNTPEAETYLVVSSPRQMVGYIQYSNQVMWKMWGNLEDAIREGSPRWKQTFGWDEPIFSSFFKDEAAKRTFLLGMHGFGMITSPRIVESIDLSRFRHLVDLGGATGHLAIAACRRYPNLKATVVDLATAVPLARETIEATEVADRIQIVAADFFREPLPRGDLYFLGRIIHDWSEEKIDLLLGKIAASLPAGGGLMIGEKIINDERNGPSWAQLQDLNMLVCTEGRERTVAVYEALLKKHGFEQISFARTQVPLDAILAIRQA